MHSEKLLVNPMKGRLHDTVQGVLHVLQSCMMVNSENYPTLFAKDAVVLES